MKLLSFRIHHYKSIQDSGECRLADDMSILIGKNEAGKTAVIEALRDFDRDRSRMAEAVYPLSAKANELPTLTFLFQVTADEIEQTEAGSGIRLTAEARESFLQKGVRLRKNSFGEYSLVDFKPQEIIEQVQERDAEEAPPSMDIGAVQEIKKRIDDILPGDNSPDLVLDQGPEPFQKSLAQVRMFVQRQLMNIAEEPKREAIVHLTRELMVGAKHSELKSAASSPAESFVTALTASLPRFVIFDDHEDMLPFQVDISTARQHPAVIDFARVAGLDLDHLEQVEDLQKRINLLNRHGAVIADNFLNLWGQNEIELVVRPEGTKLIFGVKEAESTDFYKIEQRSKGFQWFLSFYLKMNRYRNENVVVLIDELGTNLHPLAQKDILLMLNALQGTSMQILFSTHTCFLIDPDRPERIRYVLKSKEQGSRLREIGEEEVDEETSMPVATASAFYQRSVPVRKAPSDNLNKLKREFQEILNEDSGASPADAEENTSEERGLQNNNETPNADTPFPPGQESQRKAEPELAYADKKASQSGLFGWLKRR